MKRHSSTHNNGKLDSLIIFCHDQFFLTEVTSRDFYIQIITDAIIPPGYNPINQANVDDANKALREVGIKIEVEDFRSKSLCIIIKTLSLDELQEELNTNESQNNST